MARLSWRWAIKGAQELVPYATMLVDSLAQIEHQFPDEMTGEKITEPNQHILIYPKGF